MSSRELTTVCKKSELRTFTSSSTKWDQCFPYKVQPAESAMAIPLIVNKLLLWRGGGHQIQLLSLCLMISSGGGGPYGDGGGLPTRALVGAVELETQLPGLHWDPGIGL